DERSHHLEGGAVLSDELAGRFELANAAAVHPKPAAGQPLDHRSKGRQEFAERVDIADVRNVGEGDVLISQEGSAHGGEDVILRTGDADAPAQDGSALDDIARAPVAVRTHGLRTG